MSDAEDRLRHFVLLSMEAELLSHRSASGYIRDAYERLSIYWSARATELENELKAAKRIHATERPRT